MTQNPFRIALIQHSSRSDNLGVGALTVSEIAILRSISRAIAYPIEITVLEWRDLHQPYVTGSDIRIIEMDGRFLVSPRGYWREIRKAQMVIDIGAGDSFTDIYGSKRLRWIFVMKFLAHLAGKPLVMAPQTIGPFTKPISTILARMSMRWCALVATRDTMSSDAIRQMGLSRDIVEASDVALRLPYTLPVNEPKIGARAKVGLNVSGLLMNGGYTGKNEFKLKMDYPTLIRRIIRYFLSKDCEVYLVAHVLPKDRSITYIEDDYMASCALKEEFPDVKVAPAFRTPSEAKTYIAQLDFFVGARMHACIAAFSSGVPVIPMAYSRKFAGLFGAIGYNRTADCTKDTADTIFLKIVTGFSEREVISVEIRHALGVGESKLALYEDALQDLIFRTM